MMAIGCVEFLAFEEIVAGIALRRERAGADAVTPDAQEGCSHASRYFTTVRNFRGYALPWVCTILSAQKETYGETGRRKSRLLVAVGSAPRRGIGRLKIPAESSSLAFGHWAGRAG
jgi:hypothetical protein